MSIDRAPPTPPPEHEGTGGCVLKPLIIDTHAKVSAFTAMGSEETARLANAARATANKCLEQIELQPNDSTTVDEDLEDLDDTQFEWQIDDSAADHSWFMDAAYRQPMTPNARVNEDVHKFLHDNETANTLQDPAPLGKTLLPPLPRYIDHTLKKLQHLRNKPPYGFEVCPICQCQFVPELVDQIGDYIPLTCNHWVHYRCWLHYVSRKDPGHDNCPVCHERLFHWEGLTTFMICTRENIDMEIVDLPFGGCTDKSTMQIIKTEQDQYISDCKFIEGVLERMYETETLRIADERLKAPLLSVAHTRSLQNVQPQYTTSQLTPQQRIETEHPNPADGSPNLTKVLIESTAWILDQKCPKSHFLYYDSELGAVLFSHLVRIKFERWLVEHRWPAVRNTEGWWKFIEHGLRMQGKMAKMIHGED